MRELILAKDKRERQDGVRLIEGVKEKEGTRGLKVDESKVSLGGRGELNGSEGDKFLGLNQKQIDGGNLIGKKMGVVVQQVADMMEVVEDGEF